MKFMSPITATVLALAVVGCTSSKSYDKGAKTATSLNESASLIQSGQGQLDKTMASLNDLVNNPGAPDLRTKYSKFSSDVDNLGTTATKIKDRVDTMQKNGAEYMARWDQDIAQIKNEDIAKRSADRKKEVTQDLADLKDKYAEASDAFKPVMADLRDVQSYLGTDLTPAGTAAVKDTANKAIKNSADLKQKVNELVAKFQELGLKFPSPTSTPK